MKSIFYRNEDLVMEFYKEYKALCEKYGLMVMSEGEEVWIDESDESLWNVLESTKRKGSPSDKEMD